MPRTNVQLDLVKGIEIQDMRDKECSLTTNGFFLLKFGSTMHAEDFQERSMLQGESSFPSSLMQLSSL